jgi:hypothetical protein
MSGVANIDKLVQAHQAIKDVRTEKRRAYEAEDALLEADQNKIKTYLLALLNQTGSKSIATEHGTVYRTEKIRPSAADWQVVYEWVMADPDRFELLEKRLKPTFISKYMEENEGAIPPGINLLREFEVSVRRPTNS